MISKRLWLAIILVTTSSILLSFEDISSLQFSWGSLFVLLACVCWGFENNCTRMLSSKNPAQIVIIKGFGSGIGALILSLIIGERFFQIGYIFIALFLGFVAYWCRFISYNIQRTSFYNLYRCAIDNGGWNLFCIYERKLNTAYFRVQNSHAPKMHGYYVGLLFIIH